MECPLLPINAPAVNAAAPAFPPLVSGGHAERAQRRGEGQGKVAGKSLTQELPLRDERRGSRGNRRPVGPWEGLLRGAPTSLPPRRRPPPHPRLRAPRGGNPRHSRPCPGPTDSRLLAESILTLPPVALKKLLTGDKNAVVPPSPGPPPPLPAPPPGSTVERDAVVVLLLRLGALDASLEGVVVGPLAVDEP